MFLDLLQEKNNFNFQTNSSTYEIPSNKIINESNIPEFETSTNYISNNYKTSPHFKQSNKENINKKVLIDSIEVLEKNSCQLK